MKVYSVKHYVNPSRLTYVAHNHQGATPLMLLGPETSQERPAPTL